MYGGTQEAKFTHHKNIGYWYNCISFQYPLPHLVFFSIEMNSLKINLTTYSSKLSATHQHILLAEIHGQNLGMTKISTLSCQLTPSRVVIIFGVIRFTSLRLWSPSTCLPGWYCPGCLHDLSSGFDFLYCALQGSNKK